MQGSLFGQPAQTQQPQAQGSLFGNFNQTPAATGGNILGASTLGVSALGVPTLGNSLLPSRGTVIPMQNQPDPQSQFQVLIQRIEGIKQAWDPSSPRCQFQVRLR